jgi:putative protein kinase ArgK-like GTPase of G3E family
MEQADPDWAPPVHTISGFRAKGLAELWAAIELHQNKTTDSARAPGGGRDSRCAGWTP